MTYLVDNEYQSFEQAAEDKEEWLLDRRLWGNDVTAFTRSLIVIEGTQAADVYAH